MRYLLCLWLIVTLCSCQHIAARPTLEPIVGAEQFERYLPLLKGKRIGLVVNQTSRALEQHLVDQLLANKVDIEVIFAPEHGFRGDHDAGATVKSGVDSTSGLPIFSLYGKHKKPPAKLMRKLDLIVFDIQDVGARFYTYISTMHYIMEAAAENNVAFLVLDRPNPNGAFVAGPVRKPGFESFVGMHPIPLLHGMTVGELAQMIKGEGWIASADRLQLSVVPVTHWQRTDDPYPLPIAPSPNLPNDRSIQLYPSLCLFEPTYVSIGRGTDFPFQVVGNNSVALGNFTFTPRSIPGAAGNPKLKGERLAGLDLRTSDIKGFDIRLLHKVYQTFSAAKQPFFSSEAFFDKLAGSSQLREQLAAGITPEQIEASWQTDIAAFRQQRKPYLLYPDYKH